MTCSQYQNVIEYTIADEANQGKDSLELAYVICNNLGIPFPKGNWRETLQTLMSGDYMDWRQCFKEQAQEYANRGFAAVGFRRGEVIVIKPDEALVTLGTGLIDSENDVALTAGEITPDELLDMQFFVFAVPSSNAGTIGGGFSSATNNGYGGSSEGGNITCTSDCHGLNYCMGPNCPGNGPPNGGIPISMTICHICGVVGCDGRHSIPGLPPTT
jgi:hypothetical protein